MPHKSGMGAIFGIVSENGIAKASSPVYLMDMRRDLGVGQARVLAKQVTRADGGFTFAGLNPDYSDYTVMASDEDGDIPKNALVQDRVQPIPTTAGLGALGDWYTRIFKDGAVAGFVNTYATEDPAKPLGIAGSVLYTGTAATTGTSMGVPEMPAISSIETAKDGVISTYGRSKGGSDRNISIELLLDLDSFREDSLEMAICFGASERTSDTSGPVSIAQKLSKDNVPEFIYNPKTKSIYMRSATSAYAGKYTKSIIGGETSLSSYSGVVHIVFTFESSKFIRVYVNGQLIRTGVTGFNNAYFYDHSVNFMVVGGFNDNINYFYTGGVYSIGLAVGYTSLLSDEQVLSHYKSLYDNDLSPLSSGYAREVLTSLPSWYYRLNEDSVIEGMSGELRERSVVSNLSPAHSLLVFSAPYDITTLANSPILGMNSFRKTRYRTLSSSTAGLFGFTFNNQFSFSCWSLFELTTPEVAEDVIFFKSYTTSDAFFQLRRNVNGKITVVVKDSVGSETFDFNYTPPANTWVNIWVVMDKRSAASPMIKLYVGTEDSEIIMVEQMTTNAVTLYTPADHVGWDYSGNRGLAVSVGNSLTGGVCELAMFHNAISEDRIKEIWASKDTP